MRYLDRLVEEGLHPLRQTSDQPKGISQHIQAQDQNIHLLQELQTERFLKRCCFLLLVPKLPRTDLILTSTSSKCLKYTVFYFLFCSSDCLLLRLPAPSQNLQNFTCSV